MVDVKYSTISEDELKDIVCSCMINNRKAQEKIYYLFYKRMMALVRTYISCPHKAEEAMNNGFLRAYKKMHQYKFDGSFEGWLRKIVFHATIDYIKNDEKKNGRIIYRQKEGSEDAIHNLYYNQLLEIVNQLPKSSKEVFNMYTFEGYTHAQIGKMLNISEGTSKWHLSTGKETLREKITKLGLNIEI
jgi:RNA polymerase sigma-70 factor (ECF subfamily)